MLPFTPPQTVSGSPPGVRGVPRRIQGNRPGLRAETACRDRKKRLPGKEALIPVQPCFCLVRSEGEHNAHHGRDGDVDNGVLFEFFDGQKGQHKVDHFLQIHQIQ